MFKTVVSCPYHLVTCHLAAIPVQLPLCVQAYGSEALKGLKVEHDVATFKDGRDVTLVIKDTSK